MSDKNTNILFNREKIEEIEKKHKEDFDNLKKYVSDGKAMLANTITSKGVPLASNPVPEFATINQKILELCDKIKKDTMQGNAMPPQVLDGCTFTSASAGINAMGTMPDNTGWSDELSASKTSVTIPLGYHNGYGTVSIKTGSGSISNPAGQDQILNGYQAYDSTYNVITGAMANNGSWGGTVYTNVAKTVNIPKGYHDGNGVVSINTDTEVSNARRDGKAEGVQEGVAQGIASVGKIVYSDPHAYYADNHQDERFIITVPGCAKEVTLSSRSDAKVKLHPCKKNGERLSTEQAIKDIVSGTGSVTMSGEKLNRNKYLSGEFTANIDGNPGLTVTITLGA